MDQSRNVSVTGPTRSIVETAIAAGKFTTFVAGLKAAGLTESLSGNGPFTVFAPTDKAFKKLPAGTMDTLLKDKTKLAAVLNYHVVARSFLAKDVKVGDTMTLQGSALTASASPGVRINGCRITQADIMATNGVIHAIDAVMVPKHMQLLATAA